MYMSAMTIRSNTLARIARNWAELVELAETPDDDGEIAGIISEIEEELANTQLTLSFQMKAYAS